MRSSPSKASNAPPCCDDSFDSMLISLRLSASRSIARKLSIGGLRGDGGRALELRRIEIEHGARAGAIGMVGILVEIERSLRRAGPGLVPIASSRAASAGASGAIRPVIWPSDGAFEFSASFPVASARSKSPAPSTMTLPASPIFS